MGLFGPDKMTLTLDKYDYKPGEKINGTLKLNLKKPMKARKLEVSFIGQRKERYRNHDGHTRTRTTKVFDFTLPLGTEKEYHNEEIDFEIKIPSDVLQQTRAPGTPELDGTLGKVAAMGSALSGQRYYPVEWKVKGQLDVPLKIDVKKSQKIILSES